MNRTLTFAIAIAASLAGFVAAAAPAKNHAASHKRAAPTKSPYSHAAGAMPDSAETYYSLTWGIDQLAAKLAESGQVVRVSYRVVDPVKAKAFHEKTSSPYLLDEKSHAVLQVPTMEKVGPLRQSGTPEAGKSYWMVFSNKGNLVRNGHKVSVVIGQVRVDGLVVQ
jgi:hypothetical protein